MAIKSIKQNKTCFSSNYDKGVALRETFLEYLYLKHNCVEQITLVLRSTSFQLRMMMLKIKKKIIKLYP